MIQYIEIDKGYRKRLFLSYGITIAVIATVILISLPWFNGYYQTLLAEDRLIFIERLQFLLIVTTFIPALFLIWFGTKVIRDRQYPYKGKKVIRRTKIVVGKQAIIYGVTLIFTGIIPIILIIGSIAMTHNINQRFLKDPFGYKAQFRINQDR